MSEPALGSDELPDHLHEALLDFTTCVGQSLENLCSYGLTIGESYVPFDPDEDDDCEAEEAYCSQAWVRVANVAPKALPESFEGESCGEVVLELTLEVGILRCVEVPEEGEAPDTTAVLVAALQAMDDMRHILCAALDCEVWNSINVGTWVPSGPLGGQYGGIWTFTVEK